MKTRTLQQVGERALTATIVAASLLIAWGAAVPARDKSADACLSNLRRLGIASRMYSSDYDGNLVPYGISSMNESARYTKLLLPYVTDPKTFMCPADHLDRKLPYNSYIPTSYGVNWYLSRATGAYWGLPAVPYSSLKDPARTVWAADTAVITPASAGLAASSWKEDLKAARTADIYYFYLPNDPSTGAAQVDGWSKGNFSGCIVRPFPRHHGRVNCAFYDGHAASVPGSQFDPANNPENAWGKPGCLWDNVAG